MKISLLFSLAGFLSLMACTKSDEFNPQEEVLALQEQYQGKYQPMHSVSSQEIDVNRDGKSSTNMLEEISDLSQTYIEVSIFDKNQYSTKPFFGFVHQWPKQELKPMEPNHTGPFFPFSYATKVVVWPFSFDQNHTQLLLEPQPAYLADPDLYSPLQTVLIKDQERIEVTLSKRLYTVEGWKTVQITTLYERFSR